MRTRSRLRLGSSFAALAMVALASSAATVIQQAYLKDFDPREYEAFGSSVAISGDTMVVGARSEFGNGQGFAYAGAAYVFVRSGTNWNLQAILKASNGNTNDMFGQ